MTIEQMMEDAYRRGLEAGRREGLSFRGLPRISGVTRGAEFAFRRGWAASFEDYERRVADELRSVWQARWRAAEHERRTVAGVYEALAVQKEAERQLGAAPRRRYLVARVRRPWEAEVRRAAANLVIVRRRQTGLAEFEGQVWDELWRVREALDAELAAGRGRRCVAEAMRAEPRPPEGVRCYAAIDDFLAEDKRRALGRWDLVDAGGADYGADWSLENPVRRWEATRWRISFLHGIGADSTGEVYAVERLRERRGRVWLLGTLPSFDAMRDATVELERHAQRERNSLVVAAERIVRASRMA